MERQQERGRERQHVDRLLVGWLVRSFMLYTGKLKKEDVSYSLPPSSPPLLLFLVLSPSLIPPADHTSHSVLTTACARCSSPRPWTSSLSCSTCTLAASCPRRQRRRGASSLGFLATWRVKHKGEGRVSCIIAIKEQQTSAALLCLESTESSLQYPRKALLLERELTRFDGWM